VQWSKGEYFDANQQQDDYAAMGSNGLDFAVDDYGDETATATTLSSVSSGESATSTVTGTIETPADVDVFVITAGAGLVSLAATPVAADPNLDIEITLWDESGALLAFANPVDQLAASTSVAVDGGLYYIAVEGVGKGDPLGTGYTDYGSLGGYKIDATYSDGAGLIQPVAAISSNYAPSTAPLTVSFDGGQSQDATSWQWNFGDGNTATGVAASHTYLQSGVFTAQLTVTSADGLTDSQVLSITVINQSPVALGDVSTTSGEAPLSVDFTDAGSTDTDGSIAAYRWDFGDGSSAFTADASHTYSAPGTFGATLTVTDNSGAQTTLAVATIEVMQPAIVDSITSADVFLDAGTITRSHTATHALDGIYQEISERESGGRKSGRYSYAQHGWVINVPGGNSTISVDGYRGVSDDGETFALSYSINGQSGIIGTLSGSGTKLTSGSFDHGPGTLTITLEDTDQTGGNRVLDTAYIDQIFVRTVSDTGDVGSVPSAPTGLAAAATGAGEISLTWTDTATDEFGLRLERRDSSGVWAIAADLPADTENFRDANLPSSTNYDYRVFAFNVAGDSAASNTATVTTQPVGEVTLSVSRTYKVKGANHVELQWSDSSNTYDVRRAQQGQSLQSIATSNNGQYLDDTLGKGGMTITYQVCAADQTCSNVITVTF
jgi:PKD repeat protein